MQCKKQCNLECTCIGLRVNPGAGIYDPPPQENSRVKLLKLTLLGQLKNFLSCAEYAVGCAAYAAGCAAYVRQLRIRPTQSS